MRSDRDNNFNLIRLLFASFVILSHSPELVDGNRHRELLTSVFHTLSLGEASVDGFFLLSGYLIVQSWDRSPALVDFLKKRVLRIFPGFIVASVVCAIIVGPLGASAREYFAQFSWISFIKGVLVLKSPVVPPVFEGQPFPVVNGAMWTIKHEFRCYLVVALLGLLHVVKNRNIWLVTSVVSLLIYLLPAITSHLIFPGRSLVLGESNEMIRLFPFFSIGGTFYLFRDRISYKPIIAALFAPILLLCLFSAKLAEPAMATFGAYILFWFAFASFPRLNPFKKFSDISYGIYLYGWPSQKLFLWYFPHLSPWLLTFLALCSSAFLGFISWHFVEKPCLLLKPRAKSSVKTEA